MSSRRVNIVGVGNLLKGDDGVGPAAIERLQRTRLPDGVRLYDAGLAFSDVLSCLDPADALVVIDAFRFGGPAGKVYRAVLDPWDVGGGPAGDGMSLHEVSVLPALRLAALAGQEFREVILFGVEPKRVEWAADLSAQVAGAMEKLVAAVRDCARELVEYNQAEALCGAGADGDVSP